MRDVALLKSPPHDVADHVRDARHALGQFLGAAYRLDGLLKEGGEQLARLLLPVPIRGQPTDGVRSQLGGPHAFAVGIPTEVDVVGQNQVGQRLPIPFELLTVRRARVAPVAVALNGAQVGDRYPWPPGSQSSRGLPTSS